jgi:3-methyladenine DNA glycosylase AlkD
MSQSKLPQEIIQCLEYLADPVKAQFLQGYFKTGKGEYGEGDVFLGIKVPEQRKIANQFWKETTLNHLTELIRSEYHEVRLTAVFILVKQYGKAKTEVEKEQIVNFYLDQRAYINNWDLVDSSAHKILGPWLENKDRKLLYQLADSNTIWDQRIAVITTFYFIAQNDFEDALKLAKILLQHPHDIIQKAVGWMLREIGKRDYELEFQFLRQHYTNMPRTMLRYAIEKFEPETSELFLKGKIL